ncbi:asparagine synthase-related protein [Streptomyces xiamenensis]
MNGSWVVLPDTEAAAALAHRLAEPGARSLRHASGRPWLVGARHGSTAVTARAGHVRVAVLGRSALTPEELRARIARVRDLPGVEAAVAGTAGSYHLLATVDGRVWVRGAASATCRVFTARVDGVPVAAPDAGTLAALLGAAPDAEMLAARLLDPPMPWAALGGRTLWPGVTAVRPDDALTWDRDGSERRVRWWSPPEPERSLREAAGEVRQALTRAVATCTAGGGTISADLSGGLDSTSLCFTADSLGGARLVTVRWESADPRNDDALWARRAAGALPDARHLVIGAPRTPDWYAGIDTLRLRTEEPVPWVRDVAKQSDVLRRAEAAGSRLHLMGGGGDELFTAAPPYLADLALSRPGHVLRHLRRRCLDHRVRTLSGLRAVAAPPGYPRWLRHLLRDLDGPPAHELLGRLGWQPPPRMPPWATSEAVHAARAVLRGVLEGRAEPLAAHRWQHFVLCLIREGGNAVRQLNTTLAGPPYASPYHDDHVVTAALSARPTETDLPGRFKPLLTAAMDGVVPPGNLSRTTKGRYDADLHRALRRQRRPLRSLLDTSLLAAGGLIDPERARGALHSHATVADINGLLPTVACEVWLRSPTR